MRETPVRLLDASDHSLLVRLGEAASPSAHRRVREAFLALAGVPLAGVTDLHPAHASVLISYDPAAVERASLRAAVTERLAGARSFSLPPPRAVDVPVVYGGEAGPDLTAVAAHCGLPADEVVRRHAATAYVVHFVGFSPGFPYLGGMSAELAVPRRETPRPRVPAGSVAIGGAQTGIYPLASPGGWNVVGRTPLALFDAGRTEPALLAIGDRVRLLPVEASALGSGEPATPRGPWAPAERAATIRVIDGGFQTTVQDRGRPGHAHLGVAASGAADPLSLHIGNWLVGNAEDAAGLEMTLVGGTLAFAADTVIAIAGSDFAATLDGRAVPSWSSLAVAAGRTLRLGATRDGARCTLCVRGGVAVPRVLGSASTHLTSALGGVCGRALRRDDELPVGAPRGPAGPRRFDPAAVAGLLARRELRVVPGAQWDRFPVEAREALCAAPFRVLEASSRMGLRLAGPPLLAVDQGTMLTEGVTLGALQVPGDGQPILSFVEHQTTGGYPQIACVIAADLHRAGQLRPRDEVRFVVVTLDEADAARRALAAAVRAGKGGA